MKHFLFETKAEALKADKLICKGEGIGQASDSVTKSYSEIIELESGLFAIIADEITAKYITDKEAIDSEA